jgi:ABC-type Zn uptake system ZnuABC Zn-binding protein ZnuA
MRLERFAFLIVLAVLACGTVPQGQTKKIKVVATIGVLGDWARQVGGDRVQVTSLLSGNESPHTYEAKPQDAARLAEADILFRVGLGLEDWLDPVVENAGNSRLVTVDAATGITDIISGDAHDHGIGNPHIWLDPEIAKTAIGNLVRALVAADPKGESLYRSRERAYSLRLDSLSAAIAAEAAGLADRRFISFHEAWPYFARRFGYEIVASIEPIPGQEPSAKELVRMVELIHSRRVKAVTSEPQLPSALPDMLARETGIKVLVLNPLLADSTGKVDYINGLGRNAEALAAALKD